jgi:hypothetical protein
MSKSMLLRRRALIASALGLLVSTVVQLSPPASPVHAAGTGFIPLAAPQRVLDTRPGNPTADGAFASGGLRPLTSTLALPVAGRVGVPSDATAVVLNVTVTEATGPGFITVYPCGAAQPTASSLNYTTGQTVANMVIAKIGAGGQICLFNTNPTQLVVDVTGYFPGVDAFTALSAPARLLDTRPGFTTIDGQYAGAGIRPTGSVQVLQVTGRAGIPSGVASVVLNVTVDAPQLSGFITSYPCGAALPTASNLNYVVGQTVPNAVISKLSATGTVCLFASAATHLIVDVTGYFATTNVLVPLGAPARLLETRTGLSTVDGLFNGTGLRPDQGTIQLTVNGRAGIPANASAVVLNVTVDQVQGSGFLTVYPTGEGRPLASNLNYVRGQTVPNAVIARLGAGGALCIYTQAAAHLIVDVAGYITGPAPAAAGPTCPPDPTPPPTQHFGTLAPGSVLPSGAQCATQVRAASEIRSDNATANHNRGSRANANTRTDWSGFNRVDGDFAGTTDELMQWAACKWGIDEDIVRAQSIKETGWHQANIGDNGDSFGITQVRTSAHPSAFQYSAVNARNSTAYNLDYAYAVWRGCYEGVYTWLNTVEHNGTYAAGDVWGCVGLWFSGRWYVNTDAYLNQPGDSVHWHYTNKTWLTSAFING